MPQKSTTRRDAPKPAAPVKGKRVPGARAEQARQSKTPAARAAAAKSASGKPAPRTKAAAKAGSKAGAKPGSKPAAKADFKPGASKPRPKKIRPKIPTGPQKPRVRSDDAAPQVSSGARHVTAGAREDGQRVDNFLLRELPGVPKSHIYRLLRSGQVRINGGRAKPERKLAEGDDVRIPPIRVAEKGEAVRPPDEVLNRLRAAVIHEDDHYLALDKPAGYASHGGSGLPYGVIEAVRAWDKHPFIELCHRLDRDTSGVLLLAKSRPALLRAQRAFKEGTTEKRYFALVMGRWKGEDREVDAALVKAQLENGERFTEVDDEDGKPSRSRFSPQARYRDATLCEVQIFSGRTHQIRVHGLALGHPVAGDRKYGERGFDKAVRDRGLKRMFLHSHLLRLAPEGDFGKLIISAPMPDELRDVLTRLPGVR